MTTNLRHLSVWAGIVAAISVAALFWVAGATELMLSLSPGRVWVAIGLLWLEIGALILTLVWRYLRRREGLLLLLVAAAGVAILNVTFTVSVTPII